MIIEECVQQLAPDLLHERIKEGWRETQLDFPAATSEINYLQDGWLDRWQPVLKLSDEAADAFLRTCRLIRGHEALARLCWHLHGQLFRQTGDSRELIRHWPVLTSTMGRDAGMLAVVVVVSGMPIAEALYLQREIPQETMVDTFSDLRLWMRAYREAHGEWGLDQIYWLLHHVKGELFRLGRLQFMLRQFRAKARVYRHADQTQTIALSEADVDVRDDGLINGTNGIFDDATGWRTELREEDGQISGYPIDPCGFIRQETVTLPLQEWHLILDRSMDVLDIHIPEDGKLDFHRCGESISLALAFFAMHFPEHATRAFTCSSWLLDPQLRRLLPKESNIVRFQQQFYLIPISSNDASAISRVFGCYPVDLDNAPRDTMLRRAILEWMEAGGRMRNASGFIMTDDMNWEGQV